jgi:F0F1-type ATP synthase membrane subunit c/vacuolar-type H+-ATPase subunit K
MPNWGMAKALGSKYFGAGAMRAAWGSNLGRGVLGGAGLGATYEAFADDSTILGGAMRGAATGGLIGSSRGWGTIASLGGAGLGAAMGYSPMYGAALGRFGAGPGRRTARAMYGGFRGARMKGASLFGAGRAAGRAGFVSAQRQGRAAADFIGATARKAVNPIRGIFTT